MKKLIQKLISTGADFSTRKALKNTLNFLGINPENIDRLYVELKNSLYKDVIKSIPPKDKIVFIPHCLRPANVCKATLGKFGYECKGCENRNSCKIYKIKMKAEKMGYKSFIVPGGSMVMNIIERLKPKGVIGIACLKELVIALENINIPGQAIELLRDGCVNTDVNLKKVFEVL